MSFIISNNNLSKESYQRELEFLSQRKVFTKSDHNRLVYLATDLTHQIKLQQDTEHPDLSSIKEPVEAMIKAEGVANQYWGDLSQADQELLKPMFARVHAIIDSNFQQPCNFNKYREQLNRLSSQASLTTKDKADLVKMVADLSKQINLQQEVGNPDLSPILAIVVKTKEVIQKHSCQFTSSEKERFKPLFAQMHVVINEEQRETIDPYQWANCLKGLSPIFLEFAPDMVLENVKIPSFTKHFNDFNAYIKDKTLPENMEHLFSFFQAADEVDFEELKTACEEKIAASQNDIVKGQLFDELLHSDKKELILKCLPSAVKNKTSAQVIEIVEGLNKKFSHKWILDLDVKDLTLTGPLLQAWFVAFSS